MAKKTANQQLLEVFNKEIFDAEQKVTDAQETLDDLKKERKDLLRDMNEQESVAGNGTHVIMYGTGLGGLDYNG